MQNEIIKSDFVVDWKRIFSAPIRQWWILVLCAILGALVGFGFGTVTKNEVFEVNATYVVSWDIQKGSMSDISTQYSLASKILYNCVEISKANTYRNNVLEKLNKGKEETDPDYVSKKVFDTSVAFSKSSTQGTLLYITVSSGDKALAYRIMLAMTDPEEVVEKEKSPNFADYLTAQFTYEGGGTQIMFKLINTPEMPTSPVKTLSRKLYTVIGAVVVAILGYLVLAVIELFNNKIKSVNDLKNKYNAPVLGTVVNFDVDSKSYGGYNYYAKK